MTLNRMDGKRIVIYCSASYTIDPKFNEAARQMVRALCKKGYSFVSGGTVKGTMGVLSEEIQACGGHHLGILPRYMQGLEYTGVSEVLWTDTMSQRKEKMREGTCAAIALPGGIGTMDELMETLTLAKLGRYPGQVFALNIDGFYDKLIDWLDYLVDTRMLDSDTRELIRFPRTVEELVSYFD